VNAMLSSGTLNSARGQALRTMTDEEGLSLRGAVKWCGIGVTVREMTRLRHLADQPPGGGTR